MTHFFLFLFFLAASSLTAADVESQALSQIAEASPLRWDLFFKPLPILSVILSLIFVCFAALLWKKREEKDYIPGPKSLGASDHNMKQFYAFVPVILGIHTAIPLLFNAIEGRLFFFNHEILQGWENWIGLAQIMIALSLFYGGLTRAAAILIGCIWFLGIDCVGLSAMISSIQYVGFASFFYLVGRGPYSIDRILFPKLEPNVNYIHLGLLLLRITIGATFIIFAFTQKLANSEAAISLVSGHAFFHLTSVSDEVTVLIAGAIELTGGILIALGIFPRLTSIIALICINGTLTILDWHNLVDLLPIYAALAVFLIWEPHDARQNLIWIEAIGKTEQ